RVTPAGVKSWTFRYRNLAGHQKRVSLGKLSDVSLAEARKRVVSVRASVASGGDPALDMLSARDAAAEAHGKETVADIGNWYFDECRAGRHKPNAKAPKRASTLRTETLYFNKHIVPKLGKRKLADLTRASIQVFVNDLADNHSKSAARHCRVILHGIYAFAQRQDLTDKANPCQHVTVAAHTPRVRVLSDAELKTIWQTLTPPVNVEGAPISASVAYSVLLAMVTLQRRAEVTGTALSEIDREKRIWLLPPERTKNKRAHVVPLSPLALDLIDRALSVRSVESDYVFPSPRNADQPINPQAMTRAFIRMKQALELGDIRPHDLRRTGATNLTGEELGFPRFIVSQVLNHSGDTGNSAAVTSVYDRNEYLAEKRRALDAWAERLLEIVGKRPLSVEADIGR
ncbi:MAG: tyrosine-type recombinase/integrase, partial [Rhizobiaceae bacterium]